VASSVAKYTKNDPITVESLKKARDLVVQSDHQSPISIEGVAIGRDKNDPSIEQYFLVYKVVDRIHRCSISKEFYSQCRSILTMVKAAHETELNAWAASAAFSPMEGQHAGCNYLAVNGVCNKCGWIYTR
jgi:hypothetical protein